MPRRTKTPRTRPTAPTGVGISELLGGWEPDPVGQILGTGYQRFQSRCGIGGLAKWTDERFDLLAVHASEPRAGQFRGWIALVKERFKTICVWHVDNVTLAAALRRYGFDPETEIDGTGEVLTGFRWDKTPNSEVRNGGPDV